MPLRGESVGSAYVRIYADGSEVPDGIRDMLNEAEPSVRAGGKDHGEVYGEEFSGAANKSFRTHFNKTKGEMFGDLNESFKASVRKLEIADTFFGGREWGRFVARLEKNFGDAGTLAAKNMESKFRDSANFDALLRDVTDIGLNVRKAQEQILNELQAERDEEFEQSVRDRQRYMDRIEKQFDGMTAAVRRYAAGEHSAFGSRTHLIRHFAELEKIIKSLDLTEEQTREWTVALRDQEKQLRLMSPGLNRFNRQIGDGADRLGRMFGLGSRNNFLNFVGAFVRGVVNMLRVGPALIGFFLRLGRTMHYAFDEVMRNSGSAFRAATAGLEAGFAVVASSALGAVAALAGLAIALGAIILVGGPVIAFLSTLTALITALTATVAFGLVGALAGAAGALGVLVFGIGAAVFAYQSLDDAQKKILKNKLEPLIDEAKRLGDILANRTFKDAAEDAEQFADVLDGLRPLARRVGDALSDVMGGWVDSLDSPGFRDFKRDMTNFLPGAIRRLGDIIDQSIGGMGGVFEALSSPGGLIDRTLGWLDRLTEKFSNFANSDFTDLERGLANLGAEKSGQDKLIEFFDEAGDSAKALGEFLKEAGGFLIDLLEAGQGSGDTIFDRMTKGIEDARNFFEQNPDALEQWFEDAEELGTALWDAVEGLIAFIDELDNVTTREQARDFLSTLGDVFEAIAFFSGMAATNISAVMAFIEAVGWAAEETWKMLERVAGAIEDLFIIEDFSFPDIDFPDIDVPDFGRTFNNNVKMINTAAFTKKMIEISAAAGQLPGMVRAGISAMPGIFRTSASAAAAGVRVIFNQLPTPVRQAVDRMVGFFRGTPARIVGQLQGLGDDIKGKFNDAVDRIRSIPGEIVDLFRGLAGQIIAAIGEIVIRPRIEMPGGGTKTPNQNPATSRMLSATDPAVRAFTVVPGGGGDTTYGPAGTGRTIDASGWTIVSPSEDPWIVAKEVLNDLVAKIA